MNFVVYITICYLFDCNFVIFRQQFVNATACSLHGYVLLQSSHAADLEYEADREALLKDSQA